MNVSRGRNKWNANLFKVLSLGIAFRGAVLTMQTAAQYAMSALDRRIFLGSSGEAYDHVRICSLPYVMGYDIGAGHGDTFSE